MDRSNTGRVEEDVRIRVQMGKCSFYSALCRMEGNKAHKAEDFLEYRPSKSPGRIRFCALLVYWTEPLQILNSKCGLRFSRSRQRLSGGRDVTTYSRAISSHIQNHINYLNITEYHTPTNALTTYNNILVWNDRIKTLKTLQHVSIHYLDQLQGARRFLVKVTD